MVAGVVKNTTYDTFGEPPKPMLYFSYRDRPAPMAEIHVFTRPGAEAMITPHIRRIVRELDPSLPVYNVRTMTDNVETNLFLRRIPARMFVVLGPLLLVLAAIGIYAVVSYTVSHRTAEIGVRLALGATGARVVRQIVRESLRVIAIGALSGLGLAFLVAIHVVRGGTVNLLPFMAVGALLMAVAAVACWVPARRASRVDPVVALRAAD